MNFLGSLKTNTVMWNFPNLVSAFRLILAVVLFVVLAWEKYVASLGLFLIAVGTDWLDGWYARRYGQVTVLGRILDPFADKVIICGTFIFLLAAQPLLDLSWGLHPWMVVVIVGREMLVTALRSFLEQRGVDFSATWSGKWKMILQSLAIIAALYYLITSSPNQPDSPWARWTFIGLLWAAVAQTVFSGVIYARAALRLLRPE